SITIIVTNNALYADNPLFRQTTIGQRNGNMSTGFGVIHSINSVTVATMYCALDNVIREHFKTVVISSTTQLTKMFEVHCRFRIRASGYGDTPGVGAVNSPRIGLIARTI